jgi:acetyltransferase-like isoleucine patch superfamily enzyme
MLAAGQSWLERRIGNARELHAHVCTAATRRMVSEAGTDLWVKGLPRIYNGHNIALGAFVVIDHHVELGTGRDGQLVIGNGVLISQHTIINASTEITIADQTWFGPRCYILDSNHGIAPGKPFSQQPRVASPISIGADVWVGTGSVILSGVTVGDGAVVAAGSVVTRDVPSGALVGGVPARFIRWRIKTP